MIPLRHAPLLLAACLAGVARADAPRMPPLAVETICTGAGVARVCATIDRRSHRTTVRRGRAVPWVAPVSPPAVLLRADGAVLVEEYRPGGLVELSDGPATPLLVLRGQGGVIATVALADVARRPADLPRSVSHRIWSTGRAFDRDGSLLIDLTDGRRLRVDPSGQKRVEAAASARPAFCRDVERTRYGPCAQP